MASLWEAGADLLDITNAKKNECSWFPLTPSCTTDTDINPYQAGRALERTNQGRSHGGAGKAATAAIGRVRQGAAAPKFRRAGGTKQPDLGDIV